MRRQSGATYDTNDQDDATSVDTTTSTRTTTTGPGLDSVNPLLGAVKSRKRDRGAEK
jgi:hypothetical protein